MSKGIRVAVKAKFIELAAKRVAGEFGATENTLSEGNVKFRRAVCDFAVEQFGISLKSAGSAYNAAFQACKVEQPELTVNLGRAADKIGGRKRKVTDPVDANVGTVNVVNEVDLFTVVRAKDQEVIAEGLTRELAEELIAKNAKARKAKLVIAEAVAA